MRAVIVMPTTRAATLFTWFSVIGASFTPAVLAKPWLKEI
jgi:hypothetical protein